MSPSLFRRWSYRLFGPAARWTLDDLDTLGQWLEKADIPRRPDMHLACYYAGMAIVGLLTLIALGVELAIGVSPPYAVLTVTLGLTVVGLLYGWAFHGLRVWAFMRAERLEEQLPFATNYLASMAQADVAPEKLFENLSRQPVYGEVTVEARRIRRDLTGLGMDLVTALQRATRRSPSAEFRDFLQGLLTAIAAGGSTKNFLAAKADQYMDDLRQDQEAFLETLGILAETYVTVILAGPLFVIIMLTVLVLFGTSGRLPLELGYLMMLALVPLANIGFSVAVETTSPGA